VRRGYKGVVVDVVGKGQASATDPMADVARYSAAEFAALRPVAVDAQSDLASKVRVMLEAFACFNAQESEPAATTSPGKGQGHRGSSQGQGQGQGQGRWSKHRNQNQSQNQNQRGHAGHPHPGIPNGHNYNHNNNHNHNNTQGHNHNHNHNNHNNYNHNNYNHNNHNNNHRRHAHAPGNAAPCQRPPRLTNNDSSASQRLVQACLNKISARTCDVIADKIMDAATTASDCTLVHVTQAVLEKGVREHSYIAVYVQLLQALIHRCERMGSTEDGDIRITTAAFANRVYESGSALFEDYLNAIQAETNASDTAQEYDAMCARVLSKKILHGQNRVALALIKSGLAGPELRPAMYLQALVSTIGRLDVGGSSMMLEVYVDFTLDFLGAFPADAHRNGTLIRYALDGVLASLEPNSIKPNPNLHPNSSKLRFKIMDVMERLDGMGQARRPDDCPVRDRDRDRDTNPQRDSRPPKKRPDAGGSQQRRSQGRW
jgi:hypothetical protein